MTYIVSIPGENIGAISLKTGASVMVDLPQPKGWQMTVAVAGLEPEGASLATCCLSNQRVHLPQACAPEPTPTDSAANDLALELSLDAGCSRQRQTPICSGQLSVRGSGYDRVKLTLSAELGESLLASGASCSTFANGVALCDLPVGAPIDFEMALRADAPGGETVLCGEIGIGREDTARMLALQEALAGAGYPVGQVDGVFGPATLSALADFVEDAGLPPLEAEISAEVLFLLGIAAFSDEVPENNRACAVTEVPDPPLVCDAKTTRTTNDTCACRFKGMVRVSKQACACPTGLELGQKGCVEQVVDKPDGSEDVIDVPPPQGPACDPATTVLRDGRCECRSATMNRLSDTACEEVLRLCPDGSPDLPGVGCPDPGPTCTKFNDVGECCDDLPPGDASCR